VAQADADRLIVMNLYLLTRTNDDASWRQYNGFVVVAESAESAASYIASGQAKLPPAADGLEQVVDEYTWTTPDNVTVRYLGEAYHVYDGPQIILADNVGS
jgi:hypothetical protein